MANNNLNASITIGGTVSGTLKSALGGLHTKLRAIGDTVGDLEKGLGRLGGSMRGSMNMDRSIGRLHQQYQGLTAQIAAARREQEKLAKTKDDADVGRGRMDAGRVVLGAVGVAAGAAAASIKQAASFETAMLGVANQADGARDAGGKLTPVYFDLQRKIQLLGRELPIAKNGLAAITEEGARAGVATENLIDFTRAGGEMSTALKIDPAEMGGSLGKITALYKMPIGAMREMGDAINYLDDQSVNKGTDILAFLEGTGPAANSAKVAGKEMAVLGSTLLALDVPVETASDATNTMFQNFANASKGSQKFRAAMAEIHMSTDRVQKGMQMDPQGTILQVMDAVNRMPKERRMGILVDLVGAKDADTIGKLADGTSEYRKQIGMVNSKAAQGSVKRESDAKADTTEGRATIAQNQFDELSATIGTVFLPAVNKALTKIGSVTSALVDWSREHPILTKNIAIVGGVLLGSLAAWGLYQFAVGAATTQFWGLVAAMTMNPIGLIVMGIATAAALIYANWEPISAFFAGLWDGVKAVAEAAWSGLKAAFLTWHPLGIIINNWTPITAFFTGLWTDITATARTAIDWVLDKIGAVGALWGATKSLFGFGNGPVAASAGAPAPRLIAPWQPPAGSRLPPPVPNMATGRAGGPLALNDNSTHTYNIHPHPSQDPKAVAAEAHRQRQARNSPLQRSILFDRSRGY